MKYAFIMMGNYDMKQDRASVDHGKSQIIGVASLEEACMIAKWLYSDGVTCIELCGAFGEVGAKKIIEVTENKVAIGYVTHFPAQDDIFNQVFGDK